MMRSCNMRWMSLLGVWLVLMQQTVATKLPLYVDRSASNPILGYSIKRCEDTKEFITKITRPNCTWECYTPNELWSDFIAVLNEARDAHMAEMRCESGDSETRRPTFCEEGESDCDDMDEIARCVMPDDEAVMYDMISDFYYGKLKAIAEEKSCRKNMGGGSKVCVNSAAHAELQSFHTKHVIGWKKPMGPFVEKEDVLQCAPCRTLPEEGCEKTIKESLQDGPLEQAPPVSPNCSIDCETAETCGVGCATEDLYALKKYFEAMTIRTAQRIQMLEARLMKNSDNAVFFEDAAGLELNVGAGEHLERQAKTEAEMAAFDKQQIEYLNEQKQVFDSSKVNINAALIGVERSLISQAADAGRDVAEFFGVARSNPWGEDGKVRCDEAATCEHHLWFTNIQIGDSCTRVCVHRICQNRGPLFLVCLVQSWQAGYTLEYCHENGRTRGLCFKFFH